MLTYQFKVTQLKEVPLPAQLLPSNAFDQYNLPRQLNQYFFGYRSLVRLLAPLSMSLITLRARVYLLVPLPTLTVLRANVCLLVSLSTPTTPRTKIFVTIATKAIAPRAKR